MDENTVLITSAVFIPLILAFIFLAERFVFRHFWNRNLNVVLSFDGRPTAEGEETSLVETITNRNFLPVALMQVSFQTDNGLALPGEQNMTVSDHTNMWDIFSIRPYEKITRTLRISCLHRGYYRINRTSVTGQDILTRDVMYMNVPQQTHLYVFPSRIAFGKMAVPLERIMGEMQARRHLYEDVFQYRGVREYAQRDPMNQINWKATARTGELQVNLHEAAAGQAVRILLNLDAPAMYYKETLLEDGIRIAASIASSLIGQQLPVSIVTNGRDIVTRKELGLPAGASPDHERAILELLSRIDLGQERKSFLEVLHQERMQAADTLLTYVLISSNSYGGIPQVAEEFGRDCGRLIWLCPATQGMKDPWVGEHVEYIRIAH